MVIWHCSYAENYLTQHIRNLLKQPAVFFHMISYICSGKIRTTKSLPGAACASGDTFVDAKIPKNDIVSMESMFIPEPVISMAIKNLHHKDDDKFSKALARFVVSFFSHLVSPLLLNNYSIITL